MIKKRALLLIIILLILAYNINAASDFQRGELEEGKSIIFNMSNGFYILTLVSVSDQANSVMFRLNNELSSRLKEKESYMFNDGSEVVVKDVISNNAAEGNDLAGYYFYASGNKPMNVKLYSTNPDICNFDKKCEGESQENCCYDCSCSGGYCIDNTCNYGECKEDSECDDASACTTDGCVNGKCEFIKKNGCELGNKCVEKSHVNNKRYCNGNEWVSQREGSEECDYNYECVSNKCKDSKCTEQIEPRIIIISILILILLGIIAYTRRDHIIKKIKGRII